LDRRKRIDRHEIVIAEAYAASAFWSALAVLPMRFGKSDGRKIPPHWHEVGPRASALTGHPRTATTAAHAIWNYLYRLLEAEARVACLGAGLDPGIGVVHADQRAETTWPSI
jgi:CRISPR/Cas system-associated endonuclease Cas1